MPRPSRKRVRTVRPEPLGATRMTSMSVGTSTLVRSLKTGEKPWEKYKVWKSVQWSWQSGVTVTYLSFGQLRLDRRPRLTLGSIAEQVHDNGALRNSFIHLEQVLARDPAILFCLLPRSPVFANANDDI